MTVIDTSALVAILLREPDAESYAKAMEDAPLRVLSAVSRVELSCVIEGRKGEAGRVDLERMLNDGDFEVVAVTPQQAMIAVDAFNRSSAAPRGPAAIRCGAWPMRST